MRRLWTWGAFGLVMAATGPAWAQPARGVATSVYTNVDLDRCQRLAGEEEESAAWTCPGYRGVPLFILYGDLRYDVDAGEDNGTWESHASPNEPPSRIEWRVRSGRPHAIIYRLRLTGEETRGRSVLAVETVTRPGEWAGCVVAWIDGDVPNANTVARERADRDHQDFRCGGHTEPEIVSRR